MKQCITCKEYKKIEDFPWRNKKKGDRRNHCRICQNTFNRNHYQNNKDYYRNRNIKKRDDNYNRMMEYLSASECKDCGEKDIVVLQFDHRSGKKESEVVLLVNSLYSWETILKEIDKCDVRCANCHIRRHARESKNRRYTYQSEK